MLERAFESAPERRFRRLAFPGPAPPSETKQQTIFQYITFFEYGTSLRCLTPCFKILEGCSGGIVKIRQRPTVRFRTFILAILPSWKIFDRFVFQFKASENDQKYMMLRDAF